MGRDFEISAAGVDGHHQERQGRCRVSFIVPAFQAMRTLRQSVGSIRAAAPPGSEIVIVDDGSLDDTLALATELGDVVLSRPCQAGAARSRNDAARVARGEILFFVDADVTVTASAVAGALRHFDEGVDAVFGAYAPLPPPAVSNVATTYKNLLHHYTHMQASGDAETFWSGFGAVRREAFRDVGGFDVAVTTGADVEDIHLGYRLRARGYRIVLDPTLQVQHHKRYTVRGVIASDVFHRAVPWTRAMLELRTFRSDLNLRRHSMAAAVVSLALPVVAAAALLGQVWTAAVGAALLAVWVLLHARFLGYVRRVWNLRGMLASAGLLYLYYLYGVVGTVLGVTAYLLRHERRSSLNWLRLDRQGRRPELAVTLAVVGDPGEPLTTLEHLPPPAPWWELVVVATERPARLPAGARFLQAPPSASRNRMRQMALERARGEMFATLDAHCVPDPGWLERVRAAADSAVLVVAGPFHHDRRTVVRRAEQVVRYWQWRPERDPAWLVHHPSTNSAFRTVVARELGGFHVEGALILRLAAFGARPVKFDPAMGVRVTDDQPLRRWTSGVAGVSRLRASASVRYFDIGLLHRAVLVAFSPVAGLLALARIVRQAVAENSADRTFWLALPLIAVGLAAHWLGRDLGLLRPRLRGGMVPRSVDDLAGLDRKLPALPVS